MNAEWIICRTVLTRIMKQSHTAIAYQTEELWLRVCISLYTDVPHMTFTLTH